MTILERIEKKHAEVIDLVYQRFRPTIVDYENKTHKLGQFKEQLKALFSVSMRELLQEQMPPTAIDLINETLEMGGTSVVTVKEEGREPVYVQVSVARVAEKPTFEEEYINEPVYD